jgi:K+-transporting ATPase A subunit
METLQGAAHTLSQQAYAQQEGAAQNGSGFEGFTGNGNGSNGRQEPDDVVEGQFTEI